jgi:hypothetical protein
MLEADTELREELRSARGIPNTVAGGLLAMLTGSPRQYAEAAALRALRELDAEEGGAR